MSFEEIANEIVRRSIRSAVCIDDQFAEPYENPQSGYNTEYPQKLYSSFKDDGSCSLDFYRFKPEDKWEQERERVLANKDLIILDWELDDDEPKYRNAISILDSIVKNGTNQFVIIYTHLDNLDDIELAINAYYSETNFQTRNANFQTLIDIFEKEGDSFDDFVKDYVKVRIPLYDVFFHTQKLGEMLKAYGKSPKEIGLLIKECKEEYEFAGVEEILEFILLEVFDLRKFCCDKTLPVHKVKGENVILNIENTIVLISKKWKNDSNEDQIRPELLFRTFTEAIIKKPSNAMALMACELKDIFKTNVTLIGNRIPEIGERAFYHHWLTLKKQNDKDEEEADNQFYKFLLETWLNELSHFTIRTSNTANFFKALKNYGAEKGMFSESKASHEELLKLGAHYSTISVELSKRVDKKIQFGDIFWKHDTLTTINEVLLSITPHCDAVRPEKIGHLLSFVRGEVVKNTKDQEYALKKSEKEQFSFINVDGHSYCIKWIPKPFTVYIKPKINDVSDLIDVTIKENQFKLKYISTLKENYTQRIANHSFSQAIRVGITLPSLDDSE